MKKYLVLMLLAGGAVAMSPACSKKDGDVAKTYTCTCSATAGKPADQTGLSEAQKNALQGSPCGGTSASLAKGVGTWSCD
ncbi:hypothetical protein FACS189452_04740 [Bacteroidia bacterium]|nr:hypothetical protein FACS189452_04740 [Bacteroidia bacterium]